MKKIWKILINNKKVLSIILICILLILIMIAIAFNTNIVINKISNEKKQEEILEVEWKTTNIYGDLYGVLIIFRNEKGIEEIHYPKQHENEEETIVYANGKNRVAIDYPMENLKTYEFNVKFEDGTTKTYEITYTIPPPTVEVGGTTHTAKKIDYTWEELSEIAKVISNNYGIEEGKINNNTAEVNVSINGKSDTIGIGDWTTVKYGTTECTVRILGFNHDELTDKTIYNNEDGTENTYAGITFDTVTVLTGNVAANATWESAGGWGSSGLRSFCSNAVMSFENYNYIKKVKKDYVTTWNNPNSWASSDDLLWILSAGEIWGDGWRSNRATRAVAKEGIQYKYYALLIGSKNCDSDIDSLNKNDSTRQF